MPNPRPRHLCSRRCSALFLLFLITSCHHPAVAEREAWIANSCDGTPPSSTAPELDWRGLKVLWLGTSIPQQGIRSKDSYPHLFCEMMGCFVVNKSQAGSRVKWSDSYTDESCKGRRNAPKGLSATFRELKEKQTAALPDDGVDSYDASCNRAVNPLRTGYEYRINRSWEKHDFDVVVIDHGHNDRPVRSKKNTASNFGVLTPKTYKINSVIKGEYTEIHVEDSALFKVFDDISIRTPSIPEMDYWTGEIIEITGNRLRIGIDSRTIQGSLTTVGSLTKWNKTKFFDAYNLLVSDIFHMMAMRNRMDAQVIIVAPPTEWTGGENDGSIAKINQALCKLSVKWQLPFVNLTELLRIDRHSLYEYLEDGKHPLTHTSRMRIAETLTSWARNE